MSKRFERIQSINDLQQWLGERADGMDRVAKIKCDCDTRIWDAKMRAKAEMCREILDLLGDLHDQEIKRTEEERQSADKFADHLNRIRCNEVSLSPRSNSDL